MPEFSARSAALRVSNVVCFTVCPTDDRSPQSQKQRVGELADHRAIWRWEMNVQRATAQRVERREIAERLSELSVPNENPLSGNRQIRPRRRCQQQEHAGVRSTLVQLTGGVQISRPVAEVVAMRSLENGETKCANSPASS